jgi:hypothetical protein
MTPLDEYEIMRGYKVEDMPFGIKNMGFKLNAHDKNYTSCLIPFFDLCNHKTGLIDREINKWGFNLLFSNEGIRVAIEGTYKAGDEYDYNYSPEPGNDKLLLNYGFYLNNNPFSKLHIALTMHKEKMSYDKYIYLNKNRLINEDLTMFYSSDKYNYTNIHIELSNNQMNPVAKNMIKVLITSNEDFENRLDIINERLFKKQVISYENEMMTNALYREFMKFSLLKNKFNLVNFFNSGGYHLLTS